MAGEWFPATLGDYIEVKHGFAFDGEYFSDEDNRKVLLTPGNFEIGGGFKGNKLKYYNGPVPEDYMLKSGDIIVTMTDLSKQSDTLGYPARVPRKNDYIFLHNQRLGKIIIKSEEIDKSYLYHLLRSNEYREEILASASGTSIKHTAPRRIECFKFLMPPKLEQIGIAGILDCLENKIELNQRMNDTLEGIAQVLFKSWFVDFEPVKAKVEGFQPEGLSDDFSALFPDSFEDDKPKEWSEESIYSCAEYINGAAYKDMHFSNSQDALPVIKIAELKNGVGQGTKYTNTDLGKKYLINTGEILFSWSGSPETSIDTFLWVGGAAWLNQHIFRVVTQLREKRTFVFFLLKHLKPVFIATAKNKQTTGLGHVTVQDLKRLRIVYPSTEVLQAFAAIATPILDRLQHNLEQIALLSNLRDELLPKLTSGKLRVDEISETLEALAL